jgi:hypothetical protein
MLPEISTPRLYFMIMEKIRFNRHEQTYLITRTVGVLAFGSDAQLYIFCSLLLKCSHLFWNPSRKPSNYHFIIFLSKQKLYFVQQSSFSANFLFPIPQQSYTSRIETFRLYLDTVLGKLSRI